MRAFALFVSAVLIFSLSSAFGEDANDKRPKAPTLEEVIFDVAAFTSKLPKSTLIFSSPKQQREVQAAIKSLGPTPDVKFYALPPEAETPVIRNQVSPTYPKGLSGHGEASLVVLIGASGNVSAIYCYQTTHKAFALNAAAAVARWQFSPAKLQKTSVPVLFTETLSFDVD